MALHFLMINRVTTILSRTPFFEFLRTLHISELFDAADIASKASFELLRQNFLIVA